MWLQAIAPSQELTASSVVRQGVSFQKKRAASNLPPKARSPAHQSVPLPQADISAFACCSNTLLSAAACRNRGAQGISGDLTKTRELYVRA
jgi:hypothetical protein